MFRSTSSNLCLFLLCLKSLFFNDIIKAFFHSGEDLSLALVFLKSSTKGRQILPKNLYIAICEAQISLTFREWKLTFFSFMVHFIFGF